MVDQLECVRLINRFKSKELRSTDRVIIKYLTKNNIIYPIINFRLYNQIRKGFIIRTTEISIDTFTKLKDIAIWTIDYTYLILTQLEKVYGIRPVTQRRVETVRSITMVITKLVQNYKKMIITRNVLMTQVVFSIKWKRNTTQINVYYFMSVRVCTYVCG